MKLLISTDLGVTYEVAKGLTPEHEGDIEVLKGLGVFLDEQLIRWVIVDGDEVKEYCLIHRSTINDFKQVCAADNEEGCIFTDDPYMTRLAHENGFHTMTTEEMVGHAIQSKKGFH